MARSMWLSLILLAMVDTSASAVIFLMIDDPVDDYALVDAVSGQKSVKEFAAEIQALEQAVTANNREKIEKLFGKPAQKPGKDFAMPVGQHRRFMISGIGYSDEKRNKDHTEFYPVGDFAGIEVWYGIDGETPRFSLFYFKVDESFPKLKKVEEMATEEPVQPAEVPAIIQKHTVDVEHWDKLREGMNKEQIAELFSALAGNYAPKTDYLTRSWGWRRGSHGKVHETLEWRGEKGRVVVEFDEHGSFITSEFYHPGRDPVTNIAERLKWDRDKFDKMKKYVEERLAAK